MVLAGRGTGILFSVIPSGSFSVKLSMRLPHDPVIALLDIYLREVKSYVHT